MQKLEIVHKGRNSKHEPASEQPTCRRLSCLKRGLKKDMVCANCVVATVPEEESLASSGRASRSASHSDVRRRLVYLQLQLQLLPPQQLQQQQQQQQLSPLF
ncbi:MAG: hypothetical protein FRX49_01623 [Trebouxia sp. A1-2]|nr:MAG: hypothetical protein FRX49_01623 [Trebouxia sp. A1-2]